MGNTAVLVPRAWLLASGGHGTPPAVPEVSAALTGRVVHMAPAGCEGSVRAGKSLLRERTAPRILDGGFGHMYLNSLFQDRTPETLLATALRAGSQPVGGADLRCNVRRSSTNLATLLGAVINAIKDASAPLRLSTSTDSSSDQTRHRGFTPEPWTGPPAPEQLTTSGQTQVPNAPPEIVRPRPGLAGVVHEA
jgi:hypothetical protein